ncbi:hypothetical protein GOBAR_AA17276 [Gossypium barbadense]|uniref:Uncharacterized protein n=1 Tax=Gossypium barbadense TaxID=3634 RepID=A0A2P5XJ65_GOSBA|nr:hypothetical protein GOBAR_AA17276 [Gossypium barbadense]
MLVRESYGEDIAETKTERSDKSEESEYGGSFIDDDGPEFVSSSQEFSGEGRRKKKYQISESENEGSSQQMDFTSGVAATMEVLDSELEVTLPISSLSASKSGKADFLLACSKSGNRHGEKQKHELCEELWQRRKDYQELIIALKKLGYLVVCFTSKLPYNVTKEDEVQNSSSNLNTVTEDVAVEDKETQNQDNHKKREKKRKCKDKEGDAMKMEPPSLPANEKKITVVEMDAKDANDKEI